MTMKLTEANLRLLSEPSYSPSSTAVWSPAAQIEDTKIEILGTIKAFGYMGPQGIKHQREAEVYVDKTGQVAYRGGEFANFDNPTFWERQLDIIETKYNALRRDIHGPRAIHGPPEPVVIDEAAQVEQDKIAEYYFQLKRKLESGHFISSRTSTRPAPPIIDQYTPRPAALGNEAGT
ncbi:hypothetical protein HRG_005927 [Hirsutella rhossiliensis]|uniref:Uncharacterized protein n=1 Tax=Hirsutella rhossiliensis TaxID=111463 RepID=A0A9P8N2A9_9HYPO|nr:uncharacterized protein HRG_05927 [Hirsutella rhossiliensis]KAH0963417.1 hypothetical protein HRG_05927 [Hirsutella rhossiliensis]